MLCGDVSLSPQEGFDLGITHMDGETLEAVGRRFVDDPFKEIEGGILDPLGEGLGFVVFQDDAPDIFGLYFFIQDTLAVRRANLQQGRPVAHPHTSDPLHPGPNSCPCQAFHQGLPHLLAAAGDAAGSEPYLDLAEVGTVLRVTENRGIGPVLFPQEIIEDAGHTIGLDMPIGYTVDLDNRGYGAATETGDLLDRE